VFHSNQNRLRIGSEEELGSPPAITPEEAEPDHEFSDVLRGIALTIPLWLVAAVFAWLWWIDYM
jgi:hypothetical protein